MATQLDFTELQALAAEILGVDLEKMMDTSDKWITERTGIHRRHIAEPGTTTLELATRAARGALDAAGITASDLDMILVGTSSPDGPFPSIAARIQDELDAPGAVAWDTLAACTSFMDGLAIADSFIAPERADNVLGIGAEVLSRILDYSHRGTAAVFGAGAERGAGRAGGEQHGGVREQVEGIQPACAGGGDSQRPGQVRRPCAACRVRLRADVGSHAPEVGIGR